MYNPSTRLLTILELLQARGRMSGPELAARLEVSPRSVRRYVAMLQDMGIPVEGERGRFGQYRLRAGYKLPPLMFTDDEALALTAGLLLVRRAGGLVDAATTEGALAKLDRVLPERVREQVVALQDTLVLEPPVTENARNATDKGVDKVIDKLAVLSRGVKEHRRVRLEYADKTGETSVRDLEPYAVAKRNNLWNVVGFCRLRGDVRIFRVDRVRSATLQDDLFTPPAPFDALTYLNRAFATIPALYTAEVLLKTDLQTASREVFPAPVTLEPVAGGVLMRCTTDGFGWLARMLCRFEFAWEVVSPPELETALLEHLQTLNARLQRQGSPSREQ